MSLTYSSFLSQFANNLVMDSANSDFLTMTSGAIDYSEQRIYRELDLQYTRATNSTAATVENVRDVTIPQSSAGRFVVVEQISVLSPAGSGSSNGTRYPLMAVSKEFIDYCWPSAAANTGLPQYFAPITESAYIVGPSPDDAYTIEVIGTVRPTPLSSSNTTTFLTDYLPDLFMAAAMVYATGWQRDFGAQSDNPQFSQNWEKVYGDLKASADLEELRKRWMSQAWTPMRPTPAQPARA